METYFAIASFLVLYVSVIYIQVKKYEVKDKR